MHLYIYSVVYVMTDRLQYFVIISKTGFGQILLSWQRIELLFPFWFEKKL